jgi:pilus assembly protein CpaC
MTRAPEMNGTRGGAAARRPLPLVGCGRALLLAAIVTASAGWAPEQSPPNGAEQVPPVDLGGGAAVANRRTAPETRSDTPPPADTVATAPELTATIQSPDGEAKSLRIVRDKSVVLKLSRAIEKASIAQPATADVVVLSPTEVVVTGKQFGTTQLVLIAEDGGQLVYDVLVEANVALLEQMVKTIAPTARIQAKSLFDYIVLTGTVPDATTAARIQEMAEVMSPGKVRNQMTVAGVQQVQIRCTVAEVNKSALRQLGFNWFAGGSTWMRDFFIANNLNQINPTFVQNRGLLNLLNGQQVFTLLPYQNGVNAQNLTFGFPRAELQFFVQALRQNSLARILAEPNLVCVNGQKASFLVGGEIPIPLALQNTFTVEYKKFGIQLDFTPWVEQGQKIRLLVAPEISDVDPTQAIVVTGFTIPAFRVRRFESTLEVGNGQTFAMAGLLNEFVRATAAKIPGVGDLPVIGTLFSSVSYQKDETELVVLVTPELAAPLDPQQATPVPGQLMREPNDAEFFFNQQLVGSGPPPKMRQQGVPRNTLPVNVYPQEPPPAAEDAPAASPMTTSLRGPHGMSYNDAEEQ